jgi:hypothetical protein
LSPLNPAGHLWINGQTACQEKIGKIGSKALFVTFLLHKKELKSFLHSMTICDKVASGNNNNKKKKIGIP